MNHSASTSLKHLPMPSELLLPDFKLPLLISSVGKAEIAAAVLPATSMVYTHIYDTP